MKLDDVRQSSNVQDRRATGGRTGAVAVSGGTLLVVLVLAVVLGKNPLTLLQSLSGGAGGAKVSAAGSANPNDPEVIFTRKVLATTEDAWAEAFAKKGKRYEPPALVLFRDAVPTACGFQQAAVGPFYCPGDRMAYLDLDFLSELQRKLGAPGDFAAGYVIAHEIGHHLQKLLGTSDRVRADGKDKGPSGNAVRLELQADCYAGVWGAYVKKKGLLEVGDVDEALGAARAIGDDTLQKRARGRVSPETFSHGTSEQRARWFKRGMDRAEPNDCDTFRAGEL